MADLGSGGGYGSGYEKPPADQNVVPGGADAQHAPKDTAGKEINHFEPLDGYPAGGTKAH